MCEIIPASPLLFFLKVCILKQHSSSAEGESCLDKEARKWSAKAAKDYKIISHGDRVSSGRKLCLPLVRERDLVSTFLIGPADAGQAFQTAVRRHRSQRGTEDGGGEGECEESTGRTTTSPT